MTDTPSFGRQVGHVDEERVRLRASYWHATYLNVLHESMQGNSNGKDGLAAATHIADLTVSTMIARGLL